MCGQGARIMLRTIELDKMIDKKNECFSQRYAMLWVLLALVVTLGTFMLNFYDQHFSPKVSD